jgi:hypothetical protein
VNQELSKLNMKEDFEKVLACPEVSRWKLEKPEPLEVWASMYPLSHPEKTFQARLLWNLYPDQPPSLKFRDPSTGSLDLPTAWPVIRGFRPDSLDACVNWCSEGFKLHPEWNNDLNKRWDPRGNVLLKVLRILQEEMDENFQRRFGQ